MMYAQYLMDRYLGKKGQGLTEYAIILLMVVLIAVVIWQGNGLKSMITGIYQNIGTQSTSFNSGTLN